VSIDHAAAQEMVRRSGQMGVPVIVAGDQVIVGFDRPRLERILAAAGPPSPRGPRLGLLVRDTPNGVEVGTVRPGLLGEKAGVRVGDILETVAGRAIRSVSDLEQAARGLKAGERLDLAVRRGDQVVKLGVAIAS
jgi:S1-C subfamily serine protease